MKIWRQLKKHVYLPMIRLLSSHTSCNIGDTSFQYTSMCWWMGILGLGILLLSFRAMTNQLKDSALNNNDQYRLNIVRRRDQGQDFIFQHSINRFNQSFGQYNDNILARANNAMFADPHIKIFEVNSAPLLTLVLSAWENFERRQAIRGTWGSGHVVYFVGKGKNEMSLLCFLLHLQELWMLVVSEHRKEALAEVMTLEAVLNVMSVCFYYGGKSWSKRKSAEFSWFLIKNVF
jgi:hypothetical protein